MTSTPSDALTRLAQSYGVATDWWDWQGVHHIVSAEATRAVLAAFDVDAPDDDAAWRALESRHAEGWRRMLPPVVVCREGWTPWVPVHVPHGDPVEVFLELESGQREEVRQVDHLVEPRYVDGVLVGEATFELPGNLPLGWHVLHARSGVRAASAPVVVTPARLELDPSLWSRRAWGLMSQVYAMRSARSWGVGDLADLAEIGSWSGAEFGADFVLVNPLHAAEAVAPMEPSPYLPTSRRFVNPIYIHVEDIPEVADLSPADRATVRALAARAAVVNTADFIDRDAAWALKAEALRIVFAQTRSPRRARELAAFLHREAAGLVDFATWCALSHEHGADVDHWPADLRDSTSQAVAEARVRLAGDIAFYQWLQWVVEDQLAAVQRACTAAGMRLGVIHDLAVGVHPTGADAWGLAHALASGLTVGAPPDQYSQLGQNWSQPPWRPDRLADLGYAPYRDMLRTVLRHSGGIRVDHIIGLFRLWWVPEDMAPNLGTYVRYDHEALIGILVLEAHRAGAVVIGEDLGTVEPWVRDYLRDRGLLGTSILWFERDGAGPLAPERYRELCLASVTTHDLPPTAGYLAGVHVDIRGGLGMLTRPIEVEQAEAAAERAAYVAALRDRGLVGDEAVTDDVESVVEALHRYLSGAPSRLVGVAVSDLVGDRRPVNQPGTDEEYPNWRVPVTDAKGRIVSVEQLITHPLAGRIARAVTGA